MIVQKKNNPKMPVSPSIMGQKVSINAEPPSGLAPTFYFYQIHIHSRQGYSISFAITPPYLPKQTPTRKNLFANQKLLNINYSVAFQSHHFYNTEVS